MKQFTLPLMKDRQRPTVRLTNFFQINAMLDTGAVLPVMLLSATMFNRLIYEVDDCNHKFNVTIPEKESHVRNLAVEDRNGKLHVLCVNREEK